MNDIIKNIEAAQLKAEVPEFRVGDTVRVHALIKEGNRERIQIFEGTVLKRQGGSTRETFTVRKSSNGVGVEKTWPLHSPHVVKVEVIRHGKVRRAKLNYLRDRVGKAAKVKERVRYENFKGFRSRDNNDSYCPSFCIAYRGGAGGASADYIVIPLWENEYGYKKLETKSKNSGSKRKTGRRKSTRFYAVGF